VQGDIGQHSETIFEPGKLAPLDAVDFCGAGHGTYWDVKLKGLVGLASIRAQPYRLEKSDAGERQGMLTSLAWLAMIRTRSWYATPALTTRSA
jgi:hypothetical protein